MLVEPGPRSRPESDDDEDAEGAGDLDPSSFSLDEETYERMVQLIVAEQAPRRFAIVQDAGTRMDGWVAAWGMAFEDHVEIVDAHNKAHYSLRTPRLALCAYGARPNITARLIWVDSEPADSVASS